MKNIKGVSSLIMGLFIIALVFTGCSKNTSTQGGQIELRALQQMDTSTPAFADDAREVWDPFEKANPDIRIIREDLWNDAYHNKVEAYAAAGQLPDIICIFPAGRSSTVHAKKLLKDLGPFIARDGLKPLYLPAALDPNSYLSGYVSMISGGLTFSHVFYANTAVLKEAGLTPAKTYAELKAQVPILRAKGIDTVLMGNQDTWVMQSCLFSMVAGRFCGEGWERRITSGQAKFMDPDFIAALNFIKTIYDDGVLDKNVLSTDYGAVLGQFATNKGAYLIDGDWRAGALITDSSTGQALIPPARQGDILVTVFPDIPGAKINRTTSGVLAVGWGMSAAIPAGSAKEEAAWRAIKWLSGKEVQTALLRVARTSAPTRTDIDVSTINVEPLLKGIMNFQTQFDTMTVVIDNGFHADVWTPINDGLAEIGMGTRTPQQVAQDAQKAFETWKAAQ
jgi:raffinose/stachyose/melibiose transport system substrate-binding protein